MGTRDVAVAQRAAHVAQPALQHDRDERAWAAAPALSLSARMLASYGLLPLTDYLGLGIVIFSYAGELTWGFSAD